MTAESGGGGGGVRNSGKRQAFGEGSGGFENLMKRTTKLSPA